MSINPFSDHPRKWPEYVEWSAFGISLEPDGDTYDVLVDHGWSPIISRQRIRLDGADTWETSKPEQRVRGLAAAEWVRPFIVGQSLMIVSRKRATSDHLRTTMERYAAKVFIWRPWGRPELQGSEFFVLRLATESFDWVNFADIIRRTEHQKR